MATDNVYEMRQRLMILNCMPVHTMTQENLTERDELKRKLATDQVQNLRDDYARQQEQSKTFTSDEVSQGLRHALVASRLVINRKLVPTMVITDQHATTHEEVEYLHAHASTDGETWTQNVDAAQTIEFNVGKQKFRAIVVALSLLLAFVSNANAQQQPITGAYNPENARPLHRFNPYISDPVARAKDASLDPDAIRIIEAATSSAVIVQATVNMPDAPFTFVNLTNASAASIEVLIVYSISGRGEFMHTRQLAPFQRVSIGLHDDIYTFYGRLNMSMTAYFVGRGAMEWSSYRPSPIDGDPPIEVDSKFAEFLPEVR